jgi:exopolysaccharide biosynthesis protein
MKDRDQPLIVISSGTMSIEYSNPAKIVNTNMSAVSGIPMLIENGNVVENLSSVKSNFYSKPHARTAIGIDNRKNIIIVVAEHYYSRDGNNFTMGELKSLLKTKGKLFVQIYNKKDPYDLTLKELRDILKDEFSSNDKTQGLTIVELANLMKGLGCQKAINLDGGGSSTLWIKGQVINTPIGDIDESNGSKIERPVSDAILFVDAHK